MFWFLGPRKGYKVIWTKSKSENCFSTIKMGVCEFSLFCEKILEKNFFKNKNSPLSWNEKNEEWKNKKFRIMYGIDMLSTGENVG